MYKSIVLHERRPELTRSAFMHHWLNVHAPMSADARDLYGYVCNEVIEDVTPEGARPLRLEADVDGIAQMWFDRPDGLVALPSQPSVKKWFSDGPRFIGRRMRFVGEESVLAAPQRLDGASSKLFVFFARGLKEDQAEFRDWLEARAGTLDAERLDWRGLVLSHIVSSPSSTSVAEFPMAAVDSVLEIWTRDSELARDAASAVVGALNAGASTELRAFLTLETVIRPPLVSSPSKDGRSN